MTWIPYECHGSSLFPLLRIGCYSLDQRYVRLPANLCFAAAIVACQNQPMILGFDRALQHEASSVADDFVRRASVDELRSKGEHFRIRFWVGAYSSVKCWTFLANSCTFAQAK